MLRIDRPITDKKLDKLKRDDFVKIIYRSILEYDKEDCVVIGISGKWGSGKTTVLNLIKNEIVCSNEKKETKQRDRVIEFNPWNFSNRDQLLGQFFGLLKRELGIRDYGKITGSLIRFFSIFPLGPISSLFSLLNDYNKALERPNINKNLELLKEKINKKLRKINHKFIIFIDDLDRLNDEEIVQMFQLIKLIADFKNLTYILSYDREVIISALKREQEGFEEEYLEKIIQVPFTLPDVNDGIISSWVLSELDKLVETLEPSLDRDRLSDLHFTGIFDSFSTGRDVNRFMNVFEFTYPPLSKEVDFIDFLVVKYLEVFFGDVFKELRNVSEEFTGNFSSYMMPDSVKKEKEKTEAALESITKKLNNKKDKLLITRLLSLLFPKVKTLSNPYSFAQIEYNKDLFAGRIYTKEKFYIYFESVISSKDVSNEKIKKNSGKF